VKRTILFLAALSLLAVLALGCGSDSLKSIDLTAPSDELFGEGDTLQVTATGNYSYGPTRDLTARATYTITALGTDINGNPLPTPPSGITISPTGMLTAVPTFVCTFAPGSATGTTVNSWVLTGSYQIVATFGAVSSQPLYIGMASAAGESAAPADGACGPTPTN
jgi:hypothetical protein